MSSLGLTSKAVLTVPIEVLAKVFPFLKDDPVAWNNLALTNKQLYQTSKTLEGPWKWPDTLIDFEEIHPGKRCDVRDVTYSNDGWYAAVGVWVVSEGFYVYILDIDNPNGPPLVVVYSNIPYSSIRTGFCGHYIVTKERHLVRVFDILKGCKQVQKIPWTDQIHYTIMFDNQEPKIFLCDGKCKLEVRSLVGGQIEKTLSDPLRRHSFATSDDGRVLACFHWSESVGEVITTMFFHGGKQEANEHFLDSPTTEDCIERLYFSPDGSRLAVLTDRCIYQLNTSVEPPVWIKDAHIFAPEGFVFSSKWHTLYLPDSQDLMVHALQEQDEEDLEEQAFQHGDDHQAMSIIQVWRAKPMGMELGTTKVVPAGRGLHFQFGPDEKLACVTAVSTDEPWYQRTGQSGHARLVTKYMAVLEDHDGTLGNEEETVSRCDSLQAIEFF